MSKSQQIFNIDRKAQILRKDFALHLDIKDVIYDKLLEPNEIVTEHLY